jgi:molecular chaperone HscB
MINYFELFDIPVSFVVDASMVAKKYIQLQKQFHPDFFTQQDDTAKQMAEEKSAQLNTAYKIFQTKDATIKYVLMLKNVLQDEEKYTLPNDFLMDMMELNEDLNGQSVNNISKLQIGLYKHVQAIIEHTPFNDITHTQLLLVKEYYFKKKYLQRILDRLEG